MQIKYSRSYGPFYKNHNVIMYNYICIQDRLHVVNSYHNPERFFRSKYQFLGIAMMAEERML